MSPRSLKKVCVQCGHDFFTMTDSAQCASCSANPVREDVSLPSLLEGCYFFDSARTDDEEPWDP